MTSMRRVSSAGYRLQPRNPAVRAASSLPRADHSLHARASPASVRSGQEADPVKQDQIWRELVWSERKGVKEWEKNWDCLKDFGQMGEPKKENPFPSYVSLFSDVLPNTNNQIIGSRLNTPTGKQLMQMESLLFLSSNHQRRKQGPVIVTHYL